MKANLSYLRTGDIISVQFFDKHIVRNPEVTIINTKIIHGIMKVFIEYDQREYNLYVQPQWAENVNFPDNPPGMQPANLPFIPKANDSRFFDPIPDKPNHRPMIHKIKRKRPDNIDRLNMIDLFQGRDVVEINTVHLWLEKNYPDDLDFGKTKQQWIKEGIIQQFETPHGTLELIVPTKAKDFKTASGVEGVPIVKIMAYRHILAGVWVISTDDETLDVGKFYAQTTNGIKDIWFPYFKVHDRWKPDSLWRYLITEYHRNPATI